MTIKNLEKKTRAYALKNALAYKGKANQGAVISGLFNEGLKKEICWFQPFLGFLF